MGLFEFKKPKWQHKDPDVRLESINSIDPQEFVLLGELGGNDPEEKVRHAAINKLIDLPTLSQLAEKASAEDRSLITSRIEQLLLKQLLVCKNIKECRDKLNQITSPDLLANLAVQADQPEVRLAAVRRIDDQFLLAEIVKQNCGKKPASAAMEKISDEALLEDLLETASSKISRQMAREKIDAIQRQRNPLSQQKIIAQKIQDLVNEAARIKGDQDVDATWQRMETIRQEFIELDSGLNHPEHHRFQEIYSEFKERYQEKLNLRRSMQDKTARYDQAKNRLEEICQTVERLSCSASDDAVALFEKNVADWKTVVKEAEDVLVMNPSLNKRFENGCQTFASNRGIIDQEKVQAATIEEQCRHVQDLVTRQELQKAAKLLKKTKKNLQRIEFKFLSRLVVEKLVTEISSELTKAEQDTYNQNFSRRQEICQQLEDLIQTDNPNQLNKKLHTLQHDWQQLPKLDDKAGRMLDQRFEKIVADLTEKLKSLETEKDWELWANLKLKEKLSEKVVALDHEENLETVFNEIKKAQSEWKEIGPVPHSKSQELWNTFHNACNRNFERTLPYLEELKVRRDEAMQRRREICSLAAELADSSDWQKTTQTFKELQAEWKNLLHGSRNEERKLYQQFRKSCDHFFARRQEHYTIQDEERQKNLVEKEKLCEEAEQLAETPQLEHIQEYKRLQATWKKIGPAPRKNNDRVWKRFRAACDKYFNWLDEEQQQNLKRKEELCEIAEQLVAESDSSSEQKNIGALLADLQQQWKEIGRLPPGQSDTVWKRFKKPIDQYHSAQKEKYEEEIKQRRSNTSIKEELLAQSLEIASETGNTCAEKQLKKLQQKWEETGSGSPETDNELNKNFQAICQACFDGNHQFFSDLETELVENQKKKESLCLRLENIVGLSPKTSSSSNEKALSLAEELKQAMEDNFMLAGRRNEKGDISEEVKRIKQEWKDIGLVPPRISKQLTNRYTKALDLYNKAENKKRNPKDRSNQDAN